MVAVDGRLHCDVTVDDVNQWGRGSLDHGSVEDKRTETLIHLQNMNVLPEPELKSMFEGLKL